jgi:putative transposase
MVGPAAKREAVAHLRAELGLSERRACSIVSADRKMIRYQSCRLPDTELRVQLRELANARQRFGYRRLFVLLRQHGELSGLNRIYRLYREGGLSMRKRRARRRAVGTRAPILVEARPNARWSLDFVHDQFANGRRFRILNIVDDVTRECLAAIPDTSIPRRRVARADGTHRSARQARDDRLGQRHRVHLQCHVDLVGGQPDRLALHRAGKADAERLL